MEEEYEQRYQNQRGIIQKIHDVIKKRLKKFLDAGIDLPNLASPLGVPSALYYVPKKGRMAVVPIMKMRCNLVSAKLNYNGMREFVLIISYFSNTFDLNIRK
ncbi:hypothetical protein Tco_0222010 [Tanacetum coccineum]